MTIDRDEFINAGIKYIYELDEYQSPSVYNQISKELDEMLSLNKSDVLQSRLAYFGVGEVSDYLNKIIETDEGNIIAGIRHLGSDQSKPFLFIWPLFKIHSIKNIARSLAPYFAVFKPEAICYWSRPDCKDSNGKDASHLFALVQY